MEDFVSNKGLCSICHEQMTTIHAEVGGGGAVVHVCEACLESAKENFIWICMGCGNVYIRPKSLILARLKDPDLLRAYNACADLQLIQGIDRCVECDPEGIVEQVLLAKNADSQDWC